MIILKPRPMEKLINDDAQLRAMLPNIVETVMGEATMFSRLSPFLASAQAWLEESVTGHDELPEPERWKSLAGAVVARRAFADAVPSLDLVLTPNGFGVISTQETAPASKERVERLIASLRSSIDRDVDLLFRALAEIPDWRITRQGRYAFQAMIHFPSDVSRWHRSADIMETYRKIIDLAAAFESSAALHCLGTPLVLLMVGSSPSGNEKLDGLDSERMELLPLFRDAESRWLDIHSRDQRIKCQDGHELWHLLEPVVAKIKQLPKIHDEYWYPIAGNRPDSFKNDIPGAYFF